MISSAYGINLESRMLDKILYVVGKSDNIGLGWQEVASFKSQPLPFQYPLRKGLDGLQRWTKVYVSSPYIRPPGPRGGVEV
jgi:hypothetical protein